MKSWGPVAFMSILLIFTFLAWHNSLGLEEGLLLTILQNIVPGICLGAILAHLLHDKKLFKLIWPILGRKFSSILFLGLFIGYLAYPDANNGLNHALGALLVGVCVIRENHWLRPLCMYRPIMWMGMISYGMYMLIMLAKNGYDKLVPILGIDKLSDVMGVNLVFMQFAGTTLMVVILATLSFSYYESIFINLKHKYERSQ